MSTGAHQKIDRWSRGKARIKGSWIWLRRATKSLTACLQEVNNKLVGTGQRCDQSMQVLTSHYSFRNHTYKLCIPPYASFPFIPRSLFPIPICSKRMLCTSLLLHQNNASPPASHDSFLPSIHSFSLSFILFLSRSKLWKSQANPTQW